MLKINKIYSTYGGEKVKIVKTWDSDIYGRVYEGVSLSHNRFYLFDTEGTFLSTGANNNIYDLNLRDEV